VTNAQTESLSADLPFDVPRQFLRFLLFLRLSLRVGVRPAFLGFLLFTGGGLFLVALVPPASGKAGLFFIRHQRHLLGLKLKETGRKRRVAAASFSVVEWGLAEEMESLALMPGSVPVSGSAEAVNSAPLLFPATEFSAPLPAANAPEPVSPTSTPSAKTPARVSLPPLYQPELFDEAARSGDG
jgi:hypothetical protein